MRKAFMLIFALIPVLMVWGENVAPVSSVSSVENDIERLKQKVDSLKMHTSEVVEQAQTLVDEKKISSEEKGDVESVLNDVFSSLDNVFSVYDSIKENSLLKNNADTVINNFIEGYSVAIYNSSRKNIFINSARFLNVAKEYAPKFDEIYKKAQEYISQQSKDKDIITVATVAGSEGKVQGSNNNTPTVIITTQIPFGVWIAIGLGIIGIAIGFYSISRVNKTNSRIRKEQTEIKKEIRDLESRLDRLIKEIKQSNNRKPSSGSYVPQPHNPPETPKPPKVPFVPQPRTESPEPPVIDKQQPTASYLFATIKAGSNLPEFYKVSSENHGDMVFMLILTNPEAEVADFTIVPDMAPDFMKSVISDRDTYIPATFCERSIDSQNPSRIEVQSKGQAKKVAGKWLVERRMSIRLV